MKRITLIVSLLGALLAAPASAHHNPRSTPIVTLEDGAYELNVDYTAADFDTYDAVGRWHTLNLSVNLAPLPWLSMHATTGFSRVMFDSGFHREALGLRTVSGITDTSLDIGARVWRNASAKQALSMGLGLEFPSGDVEYRLGGGHYALIGRVVYELQLTEKFGFSAEAIFSANLAETTVHGHLLEDGDLHLHGAVIAPHSDTQLGGRLGLYYKDHSGWLSASVLATAYLKNPEALGPVALRLGAGLNLGEDGFSLTGGLTVPFFGVLPNLWMSQIGIGYRFGTAHEQEHAGCACGG